MPPPTFTSPTRSQETLKDTTLAPDGELDVNPVTLGAGGDGKITFGATNSWLSGTTPTNLGTLTPLYLQVSSCMPFYEGSAVPASASNIQRAADTVHTLCVRGRTEWNFLGTAGAAIKGKLLTAS